MKNVVSCLRATTCYEGLNQHRGVCQQEETVLVSICQRRHNARCVHKFYTSKESQAVVA